jgi:hypothetical protein
MSALTDFFFEESPAAVRLQLLEIYHPSFSRTYRLVRNQSEGVYVQHEDEEFPTFYQYIPIRLEEIGSDNSMDQSLEVTIGDVGELIPLEIELANSANKMNIKPILTYREYNSAVGSMQGVSGGEWVFDGIDDNISITSPPNFEHSDAFSAFAWTTTSTSNRTVISKMSTAAGVGWKLTSSASVRIVTDTGGVIEVQANTPPTSSEHFIGFTYDGSSTAAGIRIYIDSVQVPVTIVTDTISGGTIVTADSMRIGISNHTGNTLPFNGQIRHVTLWDQRMTTGQVQSLYNNGVSPNVLEAVGAATFNSACEGWWRLDYSDSTGLGGIKDHSTANNPGTAGGSLSQSDKEFALVLQTPMFGPVTLDVTDITFNKQGATFSAKPKLFNRTRTGEYYTPERFPMLKGFL